MYTLIHIYIYSTCVSVHNYIHTCTTLVTGRIISTLDITSLSWYPAWHMVKRRWWPGSCVTRRDPWRRKERDRCTHGFFRVLCFNVWSWHFQTFTQLDPVGHVQHLISQIPVASRRSSIFPQRWAVELAGRVKNPGPCSWAMTCADSKDIGCVKYNSFISKR